MIMALPAYLTKSVFLGLRQDSHVHDRINDGKSRPVASTLLSF